MKKDIIELVCMIDKSVSMKGQEKQVLHTYNSLIENYKDSEEKCFVTTCLFSSLFVLAHQTYVCDALCD